jgi:hypothetical protein
VPRVVASSGAGRPPGRRASPDASASSTYARAPSTATAAATGSPVGPVAASGTRSNPAASNASRVPGPPSPTGTRTTSASGRARRRPASMAAAAWPAPRPASNRAGATTIRMGGA